MKTIIIALLLLLFGSCIYSQKNFNVEAKISGLRCNRGNVRVAIFSSECGFPDKPEKALSVQIIPVKNNTVIATFHDVLPGTYAIGVIHDENSNTEMDTNWLGIPTEGYAVSKNIIGKFGPPDFNDAKIAVKQNMLVEINIVY